MYQNFRTDYDHYQDCPLAPIELMQYGDFQCDYCAAAYPAIRQLQDSFKSLLKFVYRHVPIPGRYLLAIPAAQQQRFINVEDFDVR